MADVAFAVVPLMTFEPFELNDGASSATVVPSRGGLVSRFHVEGEDVLFLDPQTLADPTKNVRGGIPILFPFAGKPPKGSILKQHGFARTSSWTVLEAGRSRLRCSFEANAQTLLAFPHLFRLELEVVLGEASLKLSFKIQNQGTSAMPLHFGLHPYFKVPLDEKHAARIETDASTAFNQRNGSTGPLPPLAFDSDEVDLHLLDHSRPGTVLHRGRRPIALDWSPNFTTLVLWTLPGQPFICVEPWSDPANTSGVRALLPDMSYSFDFRIRPE